jgi:hypothetical protein
MIVQTITTSFIVDMFKGVQDLSTDIVKMALYTADANLNASTTVYSSTSEVTSSNYTAGGAVCQNVTVNQSSGTVFVSFDNVSWTSVSFTCRGALIYNATQGNKSIAILNFGSDKTAGPNFVVTLPANTATSALIRSSN